MGLVLGVGESVQRAGVSMGLLGGGAVSIFNYKYKCKHKHKYKHKHKHKYKSK